MSWNCLNNISGKGPANSVIRLVVFSLFLLLHGSCSDKSLDTEAPFDTFTRHLDERIPALMDWYSVPGLSIALVRDGEPVWITAYGYADVERGIKMPMDAVYRAESISKPVTAWGVVKLAEKGLINLDAPIREYLGEWDFPDTNFNTDEVTVRRLLSNSAGLPLGSLGLEYSPNSKKPSLRAYLSNEVQVTYTPGARFEYSNPGFNLLELLIEEVTGRDFNDYMRDEVLLPLGMENSGFTWQEEWATQIPMGYDLKGKPVGPYVYPYKASGGLFATVGNIARFAIAGAVTRKGSEPKVLSRERIIEIQSPKMKASGIFGFVAEFYGYGHFIETLESGQQAVWHGGQGHGWMTHFHLVPETGDAIVLFTNSQRSWPLMAEVLNDWSQWEGYGPVKFSRIVTLVKGLWVLTGMLFLLVLYRGIKIFYERKNGTRVVSLRLYPYTAHRIVEFLLWVVITSILVWSVNQEYLFLSSVFPLGSTVLGWGLLFLSVILFFSIIVPREKLR